MSSDASHKDLAGSASCPHLFKVDRISEKSIPIMLLWWSIGAFRDRSVVAHSCQTFGAFVSSFVFFSRSCSRGILGGAIPATVYRRCNLAVGKQSVIALVVYFTLVFSLFHVDLLSMGSSIPDR